MSGRRIVITGVSTGMGAQLATELRERGDQIIGLDIAEPTVQLDEFIRLDLSDEASIAEAAARIDGLDVLVNCAGIPEDVAPAGTVLAVNFLGLRALTTALLPRIADGGQVLSIASVAGHRWRDRLDFHRELLATTSIAEGIAFYENSPAVHERPIYATSKEAVWAYTAVLASHLFDRHIRVNSVCPGPVNTRILDNFIGKMSDATKGVMADTVGRPIEPREITSVMRFLLSDDAAFITAQNIIVDGGFIAGTEFASWEC